MTDYFTISIKKFTSIIVDEPRYFVNTQRTSFYNSYTIVNVYYAYVFYIIVSRLGLWDKWLGKSNILPLWPLFCKSG